MNVENLGLLQQDAPSEEDIKNMALELGPRLKELFATRNREEGPGPVIRLVQRHAAEKLGQPPDTDFDTLDSHTREIVREVTSGILQLLLPAFISDTHREFIVRCHARGLSTSEAVWELVKEDKTMGCLVQPEAVGVSGYKTLMVSRLAYLKPGTARWPEKKYGAVWREEREQHKKEVRDLPFTSQSEQVAVLAKQAGRINAMLEHDKLSATDCHLLTNALTRTLDSLHKAAAVEQHKATDLSGAQLVAVLERLTLALDTPEQLARNADADALVGVLERLVLALKSPDRTAIAESSEGVSADSDAGLPPME